ncbi:hypothetical protein ID866_12307 [Astraeus odoratus]|nr:hypothetical protein ID866_12307 [Astraeus odoratus]
MMKRYKGQKRHDERQRSENRNARQKRQKNTGRRRRGVRKKQRLSRSRKLRRLNKKPRSGSGRLRGPSEQRLAGIKKRLACRSCAKAKEQCEWLEVEMLASRTGTSPQGRECRKQAKKAANDNDDDEIVILSSQKTNRQGGMSTCMDVANSHLEKIASAAQSNGCKMQWHYMLMEGLVGQQQVLLSKLVEIASTAGSGGSKEVVKDPEELQEVQGEGSGGQEDETKDVPGGALEGEPEYALGEELENGTGAEDGAETDGQQSKAKCKGKEKAL